MRGARVRETLARCPPHGVSGHDVRDAANEHETEQRDGKQGGHGLHPFEQLRLDRFVVPVERLTRRHGVRRHRPQARRSVPMLSHASAMNQQIETTACRPVSAVWLRHPGWSPAESRDAHSGVHDPRQRLDATSPGSHLIPLHTSGFGSEA